MNPPAQDAVSGLSEAQACARLAAEGPNEVAEPPRHPLRDFARKFWGLSAWMIELIAGLSLILHKFADLAIAAALLVVNAVLGFAQESRASAAVAALRRRLQVSSRVLRDGRWGTAPARELVRGDVVRLRAGDFVPADLRLLEGDLRVDQSVLTGESGEIARGAGETVFSGSMVRRGEATALVTATGARTYYGRTTQLVASARPTLQVEKVVARVVRWLFAIVAVQVAAALALALARGEPLLELLPLALVLLMSAVPVALPVMFTVSMALGARELGRHGVLVTRLNAAEDAATMDVLCADKTGTLTQNRLAFAQALPEAGFVEADVVRDGALASQEADQDPIDLAFLSAAREHGVLPAVEVRGFVPFSADARRSEARVIMGGVERRVVKGAWRVVAQLAGVSADGLQRLQQHAGDAAAKGFRVLGVAAAEGGRPLRFAGLALLADAVRPDSRSLVQALASLGVETRMVTGDAASVARELARDLGIAQVFAEVYPEDKFRIVRELQAQGRVVGMTGDGVNDAPALRQAEVGIAVASATDVAKAAASVVLTGEGLASIVVLVRNGRAIYQRVLTWIVNKVSRTILKSGFVVLAFLATGRFVISALGMILLVFMTDFVKIALATDRVRPSPRPETWNIGPLVRVGALLGALMLAEALALLAVAWQPFGLGTAAGLRYGFSFATLLFFAIFSLVSIRERRAFWASRPSALLAAGLAADALAGLAIALHGLGELAPLPPALIALAVGGALGCSLCNDFLKARLTRESATASN
ncbi:MAG TPA: HAD-IC family P-type ATPase [Burkholderiales bacterium]|nr:HAD-IC family P-type ATPase [Burkholderiales bacterium]